MSEQDRLEIPASDLPPQPREPAQTETVTHKLLPCPECGAQHLLLLLPAEADEREPNLSDLSLYCPDCRGHFGLQPRQVWGAQLAYRFGRTPPP